MSSANAVPLFSLEEGSRAILIEIDAGKGLRERLLQMGLVPGTTVEILKKMPGVIVIRFRGTVISLSKGIAMKILVSKA